jgi:hypothetical protein
LFCNEVKNLVSHAKETWKITAYIFIADRKESTEYTLVKLILLVHAEGMCSNFRSQEVLSVLALLKAYNLN